MPGIYLRYGDEPIDKLLKLFKKQVEKAGVMQDIRRKECYLKPSVAKTMKQKRARKEKAKRDKK